jgi:hypothetical protein
MKLYDPMEGILMANSNEVDGFKPWGPCERETPYLAGGTIYKGDLVKFASDGSVVVVTAGATGCLGAAMNYAIAGDTVNVADDITQQFISQADDATIDAQTDMNLNYNIVAGSPSTKYRRSGMQIDASTQATDSNLPIKVLRLLPQEGNALGANCKVVCTINNHQLKTDLGSTGV